MTTVTMRELDGTPEVPPKPQPLGSLVAAATRLTSQKVSRTGNKGKSESWQEDAWDMYDLVGEQRFLASTLANRLAQARFFVGKLPENTTEDIEVLAEGPAYEVFQTMVGKGSHFTQMIQRLGVNLFIPGDGYLFGCSKVEEEAAPDTAQGITPFGQDDEESDSIDITALEWRMLSTSEISFDSSSGDVTVDFDGSKRVHKSDDVVVIRVWRPHPRKWWSADSPTRSSLPILRELVGLTMQISAQIDSRLAGAGVFLIPASADEAIRAASGTAGEDDQSPLAESIMQAMITPVSDRSSASAIVPIMPVVPDESIDKFKFISFSTPLDHEARELRDEAIRRLALGQDCPPELLLGVSGMNHWGAWLVREDVVTTHLEPPLALMCDALTTQFLWPVLEQQGVKDFNDYVIWYDVDHLILRPERAADALALHSAGVLSDEALRDANGFDESDAPQTVAEKQTDPVIDTVLAMVRAAPTLVANPGLPAIAAQVRILLGVPDPKDEATAAPQGGAPSTPAATPVPPAGEGPPAPDGQPLVAGGWVFGIGWDEANHPRVPKGNGRLSGRFINGPDKTLIELGQIEMTSVYKKHYGEAQAAIDAAKKFDVGSPEAVSKIQEAAADLDKAVTYDGSAVDNAFVKASSELKDFASVNWDGDGPEGVGSTGGKVVDPTTLPQVAQDAIGLQEEEGEELRESEKWPGLYEVHYTDPDTGETTLLSVADKNGNVVGDTSGGGNVIYRPDGSIDGPYGSIEEAADALSEENGNAVEGPSADVTVVGGGSMPYELKQKDRYTAASLGTAPRRLQGDLTFLSKDRDNLNKSIQRDPAAYQKAVGDLTGRVTADDSNIAIKVFPEGLAGLLDEGRLKTVHETGSSSGTGGAAGESYINSRKWFEENLLGVPSDLPPEGHPVYGYVKDANGDLPGPQNYGMVDIVLKPETRERTTVSFGDSLNNQTNPVAFNDLNGIQTEDFINASQLFPNGTDVTPLDYVEAQVHGGVRLEHVSAVHIRMSFFHKKLDGYSPAEIESSPAAKAVKARIEELTQMADKLKELGIDVQLD